MSDGIGPLSEQATSRLKANWQSVVDEVADAADFFGRPRDSITIIGVTKYVDTSLTAGLLNLGCVDLGENRPQGLWQKAEAIAEATDRGPVQPRWHQIGHLQTNKVRRLLRHRPIIHSVDGQKLLDVIAKESAAAGVVTRCLLEVNISGDESKTGLSAEQVTDCLTKFASPAVRIDGLMAMAGLGSDGDQAARQFLQVRRLRDDLQDRLGISLPTLSMGMSGDFRGAIGAGSTMVRIGSRLFEGLIEK